jgi:hypothetical protein
VAASTGESFLFLCGVIAVGCHSCHTSNCFTFADGISLLCERETLDPDAPHTYVRIFYIPASRKSLTEKLLLGPIDKIIG